MKKKIGRLIKKKNLSFVRLQYIFRLQYWGFGLLSFMFWELTKHVFSEYGFLPAIPFFILFLLGLTYLMSDVYWGSRRDVRKEQRGYY